MSLIPVWQVPGFVQDILYLTAVLNCCTNPLIYGSYYYSEKSGTRSVQTFKEPHQCLQI